MQTWAGIAIACAALLVIVGVPKLWHPDGTVIALRAVGLTRTGARSARLLTIVEVAVGAGAVVVGARWADAAVSLLYLGFSGFLVLALRSSTATCGCTGRVDTPPTRTHLAMTVMFAAGSAAAAVTGSRTGVLTLVRATSPGVVIALLGFAALLTWFGWALLNLASIAEPQRLT
jgi:hypothetical protein